MRRIVIGLALLGLVGAGSPAAAAGDKTETRTEHQTDRNGSKTSTETSSDVGGDKRDEVKETEQHAKADGKTETKKHVKRKHKAAGRLGSHKSEMKEKTVRDANGNVIEEHKTEK